MKSSARLFGSVIAPVLLLGSAAPVVALTEEEAALAEVLPQHVSPEDMKRDLMANPENLDGYFTYAALAKQQKRFDDAAWALQAMLYQNPGLMRVKLELGLVYIEMGRYQDARVLFEDVRASKPPAEVQQNIDKVLIALDARDKTHHFSTTFMAGVNHDSNANAAPSSGNVTVVDTTIPLGAGAGSKADSHAYAAVGLSHVYDIDTTPHHTMWRWKSSALSYLTEQDTLDNLNLQLYTIKTGPEFTLPETPLKVSASLGYNHLLLARESYLRNPRFDLTLDVIALPNLIFGYAYGYEYRDFMNSATTTTYEDRTGRAYQHHFIMKNILSDDAMLETTVMLRSENTAELYYANRQAGVSVSYLQKLFESAFLSATAGYKSTAYVLPDLLISATDREDDEFSAGLSLGYNLNSEYTGDVVVTAGYQFREVQSTIQNYEYDNHRIMLSLAKEFKY